MLNHHIHRKQTKIVQALNALLASYRRVVAFLQQSNIQLADTELLPWLTLFHQAIPELDLRAL